MRLPPIHYLGHEYVRCGVRPPTGELLTTTTPDPMSVTCPACLKWMAEDAEPFPLPEPDRAQ